MSKIPEYAAIQTEPGSNPERANPLGYRNPDGIQIAPKPAILIKNLNVKTSKGKFILKNVNLEAKFGEVTAIMGQSGSGKSTLLRYIAKMTDRNLIYDGEKETVGDFKYVPQEDQLHGFIQVRKYLNNYFGLNYGFVNKTNFEERDRVRSAILEEMDLKKTEFTKVGDVFLQGLSGGERRRLSIALELVSKPAMIILDEPTSGLDSFAAEKVMTALKGLATNQKIAVILTIHQPSSRIVKMIDSIMLVREGEMMFHGPCSMIYKFFSHQGQTIWPEYNPADQAIELMAKTDCKPLPFELIFTEEQVRNDIRRVKKHLTTRGFKLEYKRANLLEKFLFLSYRNLQNIFMNPSVLLVRVVIQVQLCLMVGAMYWDMGSSYNHESVISRTSLLSYVANFLVYMSIAAMPAYMMERAILEKEIINKLYHPLLYQLSSWVTSWIGVFLISLISTIIVVFMASLNGFGNFFVVIFLSLLIAEGVVSLVSILVGHYIIGMASIAGIYGMFMLCQGFLVVKNNIPPWFIWGYFIAFHTYSFRALMWNEFKEITKIDGSNFTDGQSVLSFYSMADVNISEEFGVLLGYIIAIQVLTSIVMMIKYRRYL
jgi:ABC-type multidrug transport system ATPase subunit